RPARKFSSFSTLLPDTASRAPCAASALAIDDPSPPLAPVTSAVIPERSNIPFSRHAVFFSALLSPPALPLILWTLKQVQGDGSVNFLRQRFDVFDGDDASHLCLRDDALDHRPQDLAAELDEFLDAGFGHVGDAFAPAAHAGDL